MPLDPHTRRQFDRVLDRAVADLPDDLHELLQEVPLIVDDEAGPEVLASVGLPPDDRELCGLHDGIPFTEQSVEDGAVMPAQVMLFRGPILRLAGWRGGRVEVKRGSELDRQVWITLVHELGHHFGLDEDDLAALGYA